MDKFIQIGGLTSLSVAQDGRQICLGVSAADGCKTGLVLTSGLFKSLLLSLCQLAARPERSDAVELLGVQPATELRDGRNVFLAQASMPAEQDWLRPGMEGVVHVELGRRPVWWLAFHRAIDWFHLEFGGVE